MTRGYRASSDRLKAYLFPVSGHRSQKEGRVPFVEWNEEGMGWVFPTKGVPQS